MTRLKQAFYTFWYVSQWIHLARGLVFLGIGLLLMAGGIYMLTKPYLPDKPVHLDFSKVMGLIEKSSPRYITFEARLDFSKKIYWTGSLPYWGNCPPDQIYQLPHPDATENEFRKLVGCRVTGKSSINPYPYRLTRDVSENEKGVQKVQIAFTQIDGTKGRIWAKSDPFNGGVPYEKEWLSKTEFAGVLTTYEQAMNYLPEGFPRNIHFSPRSRSDTFVILGRKDDFYDEKTIQHYSSNYRVPVNGSGNSIFVWLPQGFEEDFAGTITGVLEPRERSDYVTRNKAYAHFSVVIGEPLPARYGLIKYRTAEEYNDREVKRGWPIVLFGSLATGAGLLIVILYIIAPRLILDAWKKAFGSVREQWRK